MKTDASIIASILQDLASEFGIDPAYSASLAPFATALIERYNAKVAEQRSVVSGAVLVAGREEDEIVQ